jgi:hypothetical protein
MAMRSKRTSYAGALALQLLAFGCGKEEGDVGPLPWSGQRTQIVDADRKAVEVEPDKQCVDYRGECFKPEDMCLKNGADIIVDTDGRLLDYVCYPGDATLSVDEVEARKGDIAQNQNNTVILLNDVDDGVDIEGNVSVDANNVVIYGENANNAVISGNLTVDGNNALVRGVRIQGDVTLLKNDVVLALCIIEGDLIVPANNAEIFACDVLGEIRISGNNTKLYGNRIAGPLSASGKNTDCRDNFSFADANNNQVVDVGELGAPRACP